MRSPLPASLSSFVLIASFGGCDPDRASETVDLSPWTRPVPAEARILTEPWIPEADRRLAVRLERDLLITERGDDLNYVFGHRMPHVTADDRGRMYVADAGNERVVVFDERGDHVITIGRAGEGPGEFSFPLAAVVADDHLFVSDTNRGRLSRWTLDGELEWDQQLGIFPGYLVAPSMGLSDGSWLTRFRIPRTSREVVAHLSAEGETLAELAPLDVPERVGFPPADPRLMIYAGSTPPQYGVDATGRIYVSPLESYQVFAYGLDGAMRWALQVPAPVRTLADEEKSWATEWFRNEGFPSISTADIAWPEAQFSLADLKVDGRGRVYVFPYVPRGIEQHRLPVDVYGPDGARVLAGWLEGDLDLLYWTGSWKPGPLLATSWQHARGDFIYGVTEDPVTGVFSVVRHRIIFPDVGSGSGP